MAKWGQGDPRWIVEERPDGTNVNNWHWSDKDASTWSKDKLKSLLTALVITGREGECSTVEVESCTGEATVNNRKGKLIFFYEWSIKLKWKGKPPFSEEDDPDDDDEDYFGGVEIPNFSEENDVEEDVDVIVTVIKRTKEAQKLKELMHREAHVLIKKNLLEYLRCLKEEYSRDLILPKRDASPSTLPQRQNSKSNYLNHSPKPITASRPSGSPIGCRIYTAKVTITESFMAPIEEVYDTLTDKKLVQVFTQSDAIVQAYKGGLYSIMGGHITGEFLECVRPSRIVQKWRLKSWPEGHYSTVTLELKQNISSTELSLHQTEVPESDCDNTRSGWKRYIFERIKNTFGYGTRLF